MVIDKISKMSIKGVKLKSVSFFSKSPGALELWRKTLGGQIPPPRVQIGLSVGIIMNRHYLSERNKSGERGTGDNKNGGDKKTAE